MKKKHDSSNEMEKEYDFTGGVRGKYAERYEQGTNIVILDADLQDVFPDSESVNRTLRPIAEIIRSRRKAGASPGQ